MTGGWRRLGRLPLDVSAAPWAHSHAALPVVEPVADGFALYLSLRDAAGRARIGRTLLTMHPTPALGPLEADPAVDLGALGTFDDSGVTSSCLVRDGDRRLLYYTGWSRGVTVPFYLAAGVAVSTASGPFTRVSAAPLLDRSAVDPLLTASPFVMWDDGRWRMWYVSGTEWRTTPAGPQHGYHIRYAESADGTSWRREGTVSIDYASPDEHAIARPWVVRDTDIFRMWFPVRGTSYRIVYAESRDGVRWTRHQSFGLSATGEGWESTMVEYPCVFDHEGQRYMLYNGDDYGRSGVGIAVLDPSAETSRD